MSLTKVLAGLAVVALAVSAARGAPIAYEGFDFTINPFDGTTASRGTDTTGWEAGKGWGVRPWGGQAATKCSAQDGTGLTYTGLPTKGNAARGFNSGTGNDFQAWRKLATEQTDGVIWISFLVKQSNTVATDCYTNLCLFDQTSDTGASERVAFGLPYHCTQEYAIRWNSPEDIQRTGKANAGGVEFCVVRYDFGTGTDGRIDMWAGPSLASEPQAGVGNHAAKTGITKANMVFDTFRLELREKDAGDIALLDEIRIGTSWADVVPEPATLALLGLGALATLLRRR